MNRTRWSIFALCPMLLVGSCAPRTELVVGLTTDLVGNADPLMTARFTVQREGRIITDQTWDLGANGAQELPGSIGIYTGDSSTARLVIQFTGTLQSKKSLKRDAVVDLSKGSTLFMRMMLARSCIDVTCPGGTCIEGQCHSLPVHNSVLPMYLPGMELGLECDSGSKPLKTRDGQPMVYRPGPDPRNCGDRSTCVENTCYAQLATCSTGGQGATEVNLATDLNNCGECGVVCPERDFATRACVGGGCGVTCVDGHADCDRVADDGCETNIFTDVNNCGKCGVVCGAPPGATVACVKGVCTITACSPMSLANCDMKYENGCEVATDVDQNNCGACGMACAAANGLPGCMMGGCIVAACTQDYGDCDMKAANGCEVALLTDAMNCGMCGKKCALPNATPACAAGSCAVASCNNGFDDCNKLADDGCETDLNTSPDNCSRCRTVCPSRPGMTRTCVAGKCGLICSANRADCNGNLFDGCEVDINLDGNNCGGCGKKCAIGMGCQNGMCATCSGGKTYCNGICADLNSDVNNCGTCGTKCSDLPNASPACVNKVCGLGPCDALYYDCDGKPNNGCEVPADITNCGGCGKVCSLAGISSRTCTTGTCDGACTPGFADCNGNKQTDGCEVELSKNAGNCGACGRACPNKQISTPTCSMSICNGVCDKNFADCNNNKLSDGCETSLLTVTNCGACGKVCPSQNGTPDCATGTCTLKCKDGWDDCNKNLADGCETDLTTNPMHCDGCGMPCSPIGLLKVSCAARVCNGTCLPGWADCDKNLRSNGCETPLSTDTDCGACGVACPGIKHCNKMLQCSL